MHRVQTAIRLTPLPTIARTFFRLGSHRRLVLLLAWLTLLPTEGRLPQIAQVLIYSSVTFKLARYDSPVAHAGKERGLVL